MGGIRPGDLPSASGQVGELLDDSREDLERPVEVLALVSRHQAGPEQRPAWRDGGVERHVRVQAGVYTNVAIHPAVPPGGALLRTSLMATHEREHLDRALAIFDEHGEAAKKSA